MKPVLFALLASFLALPAFAGDPAPAGGMPDMTKMGPWSRPVTDPDTKGVDAYFAAMEAAMDKGDLEAAANLVDFPVLMVTDDAHGKALHAEVDRAHWTQMMAPFANMSPEGKKHMTMTAKNRPEFLSNDLAFVISDITVTMAGKQHSNKSVTMLTRVGGAWKAKMMAEAGWGDMDPNAAPPAK